MAESSNQEQSPLQQEQNPQQSSSQQESSGYPIPLDPAPQVDFNLDEITLKTNNEVALLYHVHPNKDTLLIVSYFISKCHLREAFTRSPIQYKEYLVEFWYTTKVLKNSSNVWFPTPIGVVLGEVGLNSFKKAIRVNYLKHLDDYAKAPTNETVRDWFPTIGYSGAVDATGTLKKGFLSPRWRLLMAQIIQCLGGKTGGYDQITNKDAIVLYCLTNGVNTDFIKLIWDDIVSKLKKKSRLKVIPYPRFLSLLLELKMKGYGSDEVTIHPTQIFSVLNWTLNKNKPKGTSFTPHMLAICTADEPSKIEATKGVSLKGDTGSHTDHSLKETQSSLAKDLNPSQLPSSTLVAVGMHKEAQQATSGPTSLGVTSEEGAHPQLSSGHEVDLGKSDPYDSVSKQQEKTKSASERLEIVLTKPATGKGASYIEKEIEYAKKEFNTSLDLSNEEEEEVHAEKVQPKEPKETEDASASQPPSLKTVKIQELSTQLLVL
ncbi:hypothetical protein Tco_0647702 [Tanacetum coccineum]